MTRIESRLHVPTMRSAKESPNMKKSIIGLVALGVLLVASGRAIVRPASALQSLCSTPAQATCSARYSLDFPNIPAHTGREMTVTITGALTTDEVIVTPTSGVPMERGLLWGGYVREPDIVVVKLVNVTDSDIDPDSLKYRVTVNHY